MYEGTKDGWSCLLFSCLSSLYVSHHGHTLSLYVSHLFLPLTPPPWSEYIAKGPLSCSRIHPKLETEVVVKQAEPLTHSKAAK